MEKPHKRLNAWQLSMDLAIDVYRETDKFPNRGSFSLSDQMLRARMDRIDKTITGLIRHLKKKQMHQN